MPVTQDNARVVTARAPRVVLCKRGHPMKDLAVTADDGWACNGQDETGCCRGGIAGFYQSSGVHRYRCEGCDYDLCQKCAEARWPATAVEVPVTVARRSVGAPAQQEESSLSMDAISSQAPRGSQSDFQCLYDESLLLMKRPGTLGRAYKLLGAANDLHVRLHGKASAQALYSMAGCLSIGACCLSVGAQNNSALDASASSDSGLPPFLPETVPATDVVQARLDLAAAMLDQAVQTGLDDVASILFDPSIQDLRDQRPERFAAALQRARQHETTAAAEGQRVVQLIDKEAIYKDDVECAEERDALGGSSTAVSSSDGCIGGTRDGPSLTAKAPSESPCSTPGGFLVGKPRCLLTSSSVPSRRCSPLPPRPSAAAEARRA